MCVRIASDGAEQGRIEDDDVEVGAPPKRIVIELDDDDDHEHVAVKPLPGEIIMYGLAHGAAADESQHRRQRRGGPGVGPARPA